MLTIHTSWEDEDKNRYFTDRAWSNLAEKIAVSVHDGCTGACRGSQLMTFSEAVEWGMDIDCYEEVPDNQADHVQQMKIVSNF